MRPLEALFRFESTTARFPSLLSAMMILGRNQNGSYSLPSARKQQKTEQRHAARSSIDY
jgi:hypothetical protein